MKTKISFLNFLILLAYSLTLSIGAMPLLPAAAANYVTTQITDDSYDAWGPQINASGQIVWSAFDGTDYEIYLYSAGTTTQITDNSYEDGQPQINASGQIVWSGHDGTDYEIYLYSAGTTTPITNDSYDDWQPSINASGDIAWSGYDGTDYDIYLYSAGTGTPITEDSYDDYGPQINASGDIVWFGYDGTDYDIYLYSAGSSTPITYDDYDDVQPQINANGEIVWSGSDGTDYEIYLYSNETITQITSDGYDDNQPQMDLNSQIYWSGYDGTDYEIYLYSAGTITQQTDDSYDDYQPQVNVNGQIVWYGFDGTDNEIYLTTPANRYDFYYYNYYGSKDYYLGYVYAPADYGYSLGYTEWTQDESGYLGCYYIYGIEFGAADYSQVGQVYVTSYHDAGSGKDYTPVSNGSAVGTAYLTSEHDHIIQSGIGAYYFGGGYYEADAKADRYDFWYWNSNGSGDYYSGYVYAPADYGYTPGYIKWTQDESGYSGYYYIYGSEVAAADYSQAGQVYVTNYYDAGSGKDYTPVSTGTAVGTAYLTSEHDYIIQSGIEAYYFGGGYYEADAKADRYDFWYWNCYGSGDYYYGYVYAPADYGYSVGYTYWTLDETGNWGQYYISNREVAAADFGQGGQVYVTSYYDNELGKTYTPVSNGSAVGTAYLTSEHDHIIQSGIGAYYFGGGYYEADGSFVGVDYGPFHLPGQNQGSTISTTQLQSDLAIMAQKFDYVKTYTVGNGLDQLPSIAQTYYPNMKIVLGVEIYSDPNSGYVTSSQSWADLQTAINLANTYTNVVGIIVGNECLSGDPQHASNYVTDADLVYDLKTAYEGLSASRRQNVTVTTDLSFGAADGAHGSYLRQYASDYIGAWMINIYPWYAGPNGTPATQSAIEANLNWNYDHFTALYANTGKNITIGETGWPSAGTSYGQSVASVANEQLYVTTASNWMVSKGWSGFLFEMFDEAWKVNEGDIGPHWGLYDGDGTAKFDYTNPTH
ncbi:MAG: glycosyl hydrolase family 17 protein [Thermodesulfobacteriota bacterium]